ncbi:16352_t:CDS:1 [Dentiscutata erythropus]|uniref:16352_t:CDS:1 n=1 Tax=Dentiscutata erythropus TaxID=1348616 RepID=A0A9N9EJH0_9GLOM|nr:16352_t:CDS:1 [Dentiscutata erythropus]
MGDIPFSCPTDYPYTSSTILTACKIRVLNLICMWLYLATLIIIIPLFWSLRNASKSKIPDFERETSGFLGIFDKLGLGISRRQPPRSPRLDLEDDPKRNSVLIFDAGSPIVGEFSNRN